jgi:hypothetical protein
MPVVTVCRGVLAAWAGGAARRNTPPSRNTPTRAKTRIGMLPMEREEKRIDWPHFQKIAGTFSKNAFDSREEIARLVLKRSMPLVELYNLINVFRSLY